MTPPYFPHADFKENRRRHPTPPSSATRARIQSARRYSAIARLRPHVTLAQARAELDAVATRFTHEYPDTNTGVALRATPLRDAFVGRARPFLWLLLGAVVLLLAIAAVNVMNLLLSRAVSLSGDFAVRLALGASRRDLVRQSIAEGVLLTGCGVLLGVIGARQALGAMTTMVRADLPPWFAVSFDGTVRWPPRSRS